jgi:hypothetical protein
MGDSDSYELLGFVAPADSFVQAIELGNIHLSASSA